MEEAKESIGIKIKKRMLFWIGYVKMLQEERMTKDTYNSKVDICRYLMNRLKEIRIDIS